MIRLIGYFFGIGTVLALLGCRCRGDLSLAILPRILPDYEVLAKYEPPVTTRIHASDGSLMGEFARERRLYLPIQAVPDRVKAAFISAEDKNFYHHPGVDVRVSPAPSSPMCRTGLGPPSGWCIDDHAAGGEKLSAEHRPDYDARSRR